MPLTRPWYLGVANIRGNLFSVVDFARSWRATTPAAGGQTRLVLFGPRAGDIERRHRRASRARPAQRRRAGARGAAAGRAGVVRAALDGRRRQRMAGNRSRDPRARIPRFCRSAYEGERALNAAPRTRRQAMALKFGKFFGGEKAKAGDADARHADDPDQDGPERSRATTRSRPSRSWSSCAPRTANMLPCRASCRSSATCRSSSSSRRSAC